MIAQNTVIKHLIFLSAEMDAGNMWTTQVQGVSSRNRTFCTYCILLILSKYLNTCSNIFYAFMLLQLLNGSIWCLMPPRSINNSLKFLVIWVWVCFSHFSWCFGFCFGLFVCLRFIIVNVTGWFGLEFCNFYLVVFCSFISLSPIGALLKSSGVIQQVFFHETETVKLQVGERQVFSDFLYRNI